MAEYELPAILYEDTDLYYILAKDVAGLTWNTPAKVNSGGYVAGTGDLLINDLDGRVPGDHHFVGCCSRH